jgi:hypothetical protein
MVQMNYLADLVPGRGGPEGANRLRYNELGALRPPGDKPTPAFGAESAPRGSVAAQAEPELLDGRALEAMVAAERQVAGQPPLTRPAGDRVGRDAQQSGHVGTAHEVFVDDAASRIELSRMGHDARTVGRTSNESNEFDASGT